MPNKAGLSKLAVKLAEGCQVEESRPGFLRGASRTRPVMMTVQAESPSDGVQPHQFVLWPAIAGTFLTVAYSDVRFFPTLSVSSKSKFWIRWTNRSYYALAIEYIFFALEGDPESPMAPPAASVGPTQAVPRKI